MFCHVCLLTPPALLKVQAKLNAGQIQLPYQATISKTFSVSIKAYWHRNANTLRPGNDPATKPPLDSLLHSPKAFKSLKT